MSKKGGLLEKLARSRIYVNAYALVFNQVISAGLGFVYWMLAARLYRVEVVGASSAAISTLVLVSGVAQLGLGGGMNRFVPRAGRQTRRLIVWAYVVTVVLSCSFGLLALWLLRVARPDSLPGISYIAPPLAVLATVLWSLFTFQDGVLIGLRKSAWVLIENSVYNVSKIALLVVGAWLLRDAGIVESWFIPTPFVIALVGWVVFAKFLRQPMAAPSPGVEPPTLREVAFSVTGDHAGSMVAEAAVRALPLMVVAALGAAENAYFYQAWMIAMALSLVASGMANSYSAEVAGDRQHITEYSWGILRHIAVLVVPAVAVAFLAAPLVLALFGAEYARQGTAVLRWLVLATIPAAFVVWYLAYSRVVGHIRTVFAVQTTRAVLLLGLSYVLLPRIGIEGIGIAWLVVNTGVAAYGLVDSGGVLFPSGYGADGETASPAYVLQRGDWRFLLPRPTPRKAAVFASGLLGASARAFAQQSVEGGSAEAIDCDVAVARQPDRETLAACFASLTPGGACYTEWSAWGRGSARSVRSRMEAAGFADVRVYWPTPRATTARVWLPLSTKPSRLAVPLRQIALEHYSFRLGGLIASWGIRLLLELGPFPTVSAVGTRPVAHEAAIEREPGDFPWLRAAGSTAQRQAAPAYDFAIMRAGGGYFESKVNWLLLAGDPPEIRWVAKSSRHAASAALLRHERRALTVYERRQPAGTGLVAPRCVLWVDDAVSPLLTQTALTGTSMRTALKSDSYEDLAGRMTAALAQTAGACAPVPRDVWWGRLVGPRLDRLSQRLAGVVEPAFFESLDACLSGLHELPLVWTHNDCTPWNLVLIGDRIGAFDWEEADSRGLPGIDLVYCLATIAFAQDDVTATPKAAETYERLLDPLDTRGIVFRASIEDYARAVGVRAENVPALRVLTWLWHVDHEMRHLLAGDEAPTAEALSGSVILPLLRREVAEFQSAVARDAGSSTPTHVVVVSPHLDDAGLSCGAAIRHLVDHGSSVTVVTVFAGDENPGIELSGLARRSHRSWALEDRPFESRRAEDMRAMAVLGADYVHLGLKDAVYRRGANGRATYPRRVDATVEPNDAAAFERDASTTLGPVLARHPESLVFCPAGVGGHVDHLLVREFVEGACDPARIVYYEEYPYSSWPGWDEKGGELVGTLPQVIFAPSVSELRAKIEAVTCYSSQLRGLFPTRAERSAEILSARLPLVGGLFVRPPHFERSAERARRSIASDVARSGGEVYWLAASGASNPFALRAGSGPTNRPQSFS